MKNNRAVLAAIVAVGAVVSAQCSSSQTSMPTAPAATSSAASARLVGDITTSTPELGKLKICKSASSNVDGTFSVVAATPGNVTVASPLTVAPGTCKIAVESSNMQTLDGSNITVTETSAGFVSVSAQRIDGIVVTPQAFSDGGTVWVNSVHGYALTYVNTVEVTGNQGCTPGYWGRPQHMDSWVGYSPNADFDTTFGVNFHNVNITLLDAVNLGGGGVKALGRHAVAALLNTTNAGVAYPYTTAQVLDIVQGDGAYTGLSVNQRKDLLEAANQLGCPLN